MKANSFYPVLLTENIAGSTSFYKEHFGFAAVFESDWYVSLKLVDASYPFEFALLDPTHETIPAGFRKATSGMIVNFEVENVDEVYERLIGEAKLPLHLDIRDETFGQRHFITSDPNGILLDIIQVIPPTGEHAEQYNEQVWS
ncbi:VOC family protein [Paenibacillus sp. GCM10027627]|uniref:VOC family protein n=1 Tax=unclassified Paenibacillus TaxID=185978 RepID=UPI003634EA34